MKRTLMLKNRELLDFEIDFATGKVCILDAPDADDALLVSLGLVGADMNKAVARAIRMRCISTHRDDISQVLDAFGARSVIELAFMGHGLSCMDKLWYRTPGSSDRWEDINFYDNDWDDTYRTSILTLDYANLASASPDIPDVTTSGHLRKAWERSDGCIQLLKEPLFSHGHDLEGAVLASELCRLLFGQDNYQPITVVERFGRRFSASALMVGRDEELVQGARLFTMSNFSESEIKSLLGGASPQSYIDIMSRVGEPDVYANVAKMYASKDLMFLADIHEGNFGIIRNIETGALHAAPPFDYDRAFGFPYEEFPVENLCENPELAGLICAFSFSDLDSSWDWSWYDPQMLDGFEDRIIETYAAFHDLHPRFAELVAYLFVAQREYVNGIARV